MKVVYAQAGRSGVVVEKTVSFENDEFDRFLATIPDDGLIVKPYIRTERKQV